MKKTIFWGVCEREKGGGKGGRERTSTIIQSFKERLQGWGMAQWVKYRLCDHNDLSMAAAMYEGQVWQHVPVIPESGGKDGRILGTH